MWLFWEGEFYCYKSKFLMVLIWFGVEGKVLRLVFEFIGKYFLCIFKNKNFSFD